jgi:hypothetical protein
MEICENDWEKNFTVMPNKIDQLIINSPYEEPKEHWSYNPNTQAFDRLPGRRSAGYFVAGQGSNQYNDQGEFKTIPLVNEIRKRIKIWKTTTLVLEFSIPLMASPIIIITITPPMLTAL